MKKTSGILLALLLSSQFALAAKKDCSIEGYRMDCTSAKGNFIESYRLSSIVNIDTRKPFGEVQYVVVIPDGKSVKQIEIGKNVYEKIMQYMKNTN